MSNRRLISVAVFIFAILFVLHIFGFLNFAENILRQTTSPFIKTLYQTGLGLRNFFQPYLSRRDLSLENRACREELNKTYLEQTELFFLRQENQSLRANLNFLKQEKKFIMAEVIGKGLRGMAQAVIINRGVKDNIQEGNPVIVDNGFLLGKVIRVEKDISFVQLIIDNQSKIAVSILNQTRTLGVAQGEHGLSIEMVMIPQNEQIQIGDLVITSGLETNLPRGLIIGKIDSIKKELDEPFQSALLRPLIDLNKAIVVSVLIN